MKDKLDIHEREEKKKVLVGICPICNKEVRGSTRPQIWWNITLHIKQKHPDDPKGKQLIKEFEDSGKINNG